MRVLAILALAASASATLVARQDANTTVANTTDTANGTEVNPCANTCVVMNAQSDNCTADLWNSTQCNSTEVCTPTSYSAWTDCFSCMIQKQTSPNGVALLTTQFAQSQLDDMVAGCKSVNKTFSTDGTTKLVQDNSTTTNGTGPSSTSATPSATPSGKSAAMGLIPAGATAFFAAAVVVLL